MVSSFNADQLAIIDLQACWMRRAIRCSPQIRHWDSPTTSPCANNLITTGAVRLVSLYGHPRFVNSPTATSPGDRHDRPSVHARAATRRANRR